MARISSMPDVSKPPFSMKGWIKTAALLLDVGAYTCNALLATFANGLSTAVWIQHPYLLQNLARPSPTMVLIRVLQIPVTSTSMYFFVNFAVVSPSLPTIWHF
jgi:hypothetical protein